MVRFTIYFATDIHGSERCFRTSPEEHARMAADEAYQGLVFDRLMRASVERWVDMAETRLREAGLPCLVMPGNDDIPVVKNLLSQSSWLIQGEDRVIDFGPYQVLSFGYSTQTPWYSPRELSEEQMGRRLGDLAERIQPGRPVIFNVHNPPAGSGTDLAFKLTDDMRIATAGGEPVWTPAGSRGRWPGGYASAAALTFDVDARSVMLSADPAAASRAPLMSH